MGIGMFTEGTIWVLTHGQRNLRQAFGLPECQVLSSTHARSYRLKLAQDDGLP